MPTSNRRPSWLRIICTPHNLAHLTPRKCDGCNQWTIVCESSVWESYDPGIVTGDDVLVAVILNRPLTRLQWVNGLEQVRLVNEAATLDLDPTAMYLTRHDCGHTPISLTPYKPPRRRRVSRNSWDCEREPTTDEIEAFERIWAMPLERLEQAS